MIFLIDYDRELGLQSLKRFEDAERAAATQARFDLELHHHRQGLIREVVLLEAADEAAVRRSHGRYFYNLKDLAGRLDRATTARGS
jgi:hypothetical protein